MLRQKAVPDESDPHRLSPEAIEGPKQPQTADSPGKSGPQHFTSSASDSQEAPDASWVCRWIRVWLRFTKSRWRGLEHFGTDVATTIDATSAEPIKRKSIFGFVLHFA